jgi:hypothetical protein
LVDNAFCLGKQIEEKNQCIYKYSVWFIYCPTWSSTRWRFA